MDINIITDTLDGSNWINVDFTSDLNCLDHDRILELELIRHKHKLPGGTSMPSSITKYGKWTDSTTVHIENPTPAFEKDLMIWKLS